MADTIKDIEKRRADRAAKHKAACEVRDAKDLEALDACEELHGVGEVRTVKVPTAPPMPGTVIIRRPAPEEYRAWKGITARASATMSEKDAAAADLARDVVIYPEAEAYAKLVEVCPGAPTLVAVEALKFAGGAEDRGKE